MIYQDCEGVIAPLPWILHHFCKSCVFKWSEAWADCSSPWVYKNPTWSNQWVASVAGSSWASPERGWWHLLVVRHGHLRALSNSCPNCASGGLSWMVWIPPKHTKQLPTYWDNKVPPVPPIPPRRRNLRFEGGDGKRWLWRQCRGRGLRSRWPKCCGLVQDGLFNRRGFWGLCAPAWLSSAGRLGKLSVILPAAGNWDLAFVSIGKPVRLWQACRNSASQQLNIPENSMHQSLIYHSR